MAETMTAAGLYEMAKGWPDEARPEGVYHHADVVTPTLGPDAGKEVTNHKWKDHPGECGADCYEFCHIFSLPHAIALHEAAGLRWLAGKRVDVTLVHEGDVYGVEFKELRQMFTGRTLLHAIDAAIRGVG